MSTNRLHNYLRRHRKKVAFTQREVAFLLGCNHVGKISRCEKFNLVPHLSTVLAYEVIFQAPARELFAGLYENISRDIKERAQVMLGQLNQDSDDPRLRLKVEHLERVVSA
jgi:transcriptional regulator with XRE-family HTH domain